MPPHSLCWFHVTRDLQGSGNGQSHFLLCWEPGKWTETAQWAKAEETQALADEREPAKTPHGMVTPHGGLLGAAEAPWGCSPCLSEPQPGAGQPQSWTLGTGTGCQTCGQGPQGTDSPQGAERVSWAMAAARGAWRAGQGQGGSSVLTALTVFCHGCKSQN